MKTRDEFRMNVQKILKLIENYTIESLTEYDTFIGSITVLKIEHIQRVNE